MRRSCRGPSPTRGPGAGSSPRGAQVGPPRAPPRGTGTASRRGRPLVPARRGSSWLSPPWEVRHTAGPPPVSGCLREASGWRTPSVTSPADGTHDTGPVPRSRGEGPPASGLFHWPGRRDVAGEALRPQGSFGVEDRAALTQGPDRERPEVERTRSAGGSGVGRAVHGPSQSRAVKKTLH